ncbi:MAG: beta-ketoacyl-[acyl-carrier-protein] synthase family protein, partial [Cytophagales bacterium]|nr:beta-ketoacyl-[acyl-carrier-protein] synthase family protein [Cytophagales bacterium]
MGRVLVTGLGIISALGENLDQHRESLAHGRCGISQMTLVNSRYADIFLFGEIKRSTSDLRNSIKITEPGVTRTTLLGLHAFEQAIKDSGLLPEQISDPSTALVIGTNVGGMCLTDELFQDSNGIGTGTEYVGNYDMGSVGIFLQGKYQLQGIINTIHTACSASANAIMYGSRLIKNGLAKRVIVGGVDSLSKFTINGFNSLNILSPELCRPFDRDRKGLNLGEAAGFLVLESEEIAGVKRKYAEVSGYGNTNDAFHPSSLSDEGNGPWLAMSEALEVAKLSPESIGYINTHGTATENNDASESVALVKLFGQVPPFSSTKSNTGHTLGASGAVEAIFCML